jgi:enoyl-[acyl-carrier protein] reductase II
MIRTGLCDLLGCKYPIVQAAMGPFDTTKLAYAVSNAGGMGVISHPAWDMEFVRSGFSMKGKELEEQIIKLQDKVTGSLKVVNENTDKPFGLNLRVAPEQVEMPRLLDTILEEREKNTDLKRKFRLFISSAGNPKQEILAKVKSEGMIWFHTCSTAYHARKAVEAGVDGVIATGFEAGGHVGLDSNHTMVLIPTVTRTIDVPVIAGGGIATGAQMVAALALGAKGIYMGTRFIATNEHDFHTKVKEAMISAKKIYPKGNTTLVAPGIFGTLRHLRNEFSEELYKLWMGGKDRDDILKYEADGYLKGVSDGDIVKGALWAGQAVVLLDNIESAKEVIDSILEEAERILRGMPEFLS